MALSGSGRSLSPLFDAACRIAVLSVLIGPVSWTRCVEAAPPSAAETSAAAPASQTPALEAYVEMKKAAEEAAEAPEGPQRIAKCEAFLKEHPDYPQLYEVLFPLIQDSLKTGDFDSARMAVSIERLVSMAREGETAFWDPSWLVGEYYFRYGLPLDSASRLIDIGWKRLDQDRRERQWEKEPNEVFRKMEEEEVGYRESLLRLDEARLRLARGDAGGALRILQRDGKGKDLDEAGLFLRTRADGRIKTIPLAGTDWYELTLSRAYAALGNRAQASAHLERILGFGEITPDLKDALAQLRSELGQPAPGLREFRAEPSQAPELKLKDLDGKASQLSDYRGRVVLLVFWTTW